MDSPQYGDGTIPGSEDALSFKPYYKWIVLNTIIERQYNVQMS